MITRRLAHLGPLFATGLLGLLAFALVAPTARAQEASIEVVSVAHDPAGSLTVTLTGDAASQVDAASLEASIEGVELGAATELDAGSAPPPAASIVILIETSSSADFGVLDRAKASALALVDELNPQDRVAIVSMSDSAEVVSDFTTDRAETRAAIEGLSLGFFAGIFSGVGTAADLIAPEPGPKAVVALGWGWDFGGASTISRTAATEAAAASGASHYWVPLGFDWDAAFFNGLMTANGGRQLGEAEVQQVARELAPASDQQRVFRFSTPVLGQGERTLTLTAAGEELAVPFEVDNTGLLAIESVEAGAPGEPIAVTLGGALPASQLSLEATLDGEALAIEASASALRIDPWAFTPGDAELVVTVRGAGGEAARATAPVTIPSLDPQLTLAEVADADYPSVAAAWRVQNDPGAHLEVRVAGEVVADTMEPGIIVEVPAGASVTAAILSADGAELASESFSMPAASASGGGTSIPTSYFVLAAVLLSSATAIYLLRKTVKRRPRPPRVRLRIVLRPTRRRLLGCCRAVPPRARLRRDHGRGQRRDARGRRAGACAHARRRRAPRAGAQRAAFGRSVAAVRCHAVGWRRALRAPDLDRHRRRQLSRVPLRAGHARRDRRGRRGRRGGSGGRMGSRGRVRHRRGGGRDRLRGRVARSPRQTPGQNETAHRRLLDGARSLALLVPPAPEPLLAGQGSEAFPRSAEGNVAQIERLMG